jgi:hypothetical protein
VSFSGLSVEGGAGVPPDRGAGVPPVLGAGAGVPLPLPSPGAWVALPGPLDGVVGVVGIVAAGVVVVTVGG